MQISNMYAFSKWSQICELWVNFRQLHKFPKSPYAKAEKLICTEEQVNITPHRLVVINFISGFFSPWFNFPIFYFSTAQITNPKHFYAKHDFDSSFWMLPIDVGKTHLAATEHLSQEMWRESCGVKVQPSQCSHQRARNKQEICEWTFHCFIVDLFSCLKVTYHQGKNATICVPGAVCCS